MTALFKLAWVELKLVLREPFTLLFVFLFPLVVLLVIAGVFGSDPDPEFRGARPNDYYAASYVGTVIAALTLVGVPVHLASYRERGILRRLEASSVPASTVLGAQAAVNFLLATLASVFLLIAAWLIYDIAAPVSWSGVVLAFALGALSFITLGIMLGLLMPTARSAQAIGLGLFFPMWMLSGAGPPPAVMSDTMRTVSDLLPMTYLVTALQDPWLGMGTNAGMLGLLAAISALSVAVSLLRARAAT